MLEHKNKNFNLSLKNNSFLKKGFTLTLKKPKGNNPLKKGFTLIEFIIVMAIIGILVLMASPKFLDYVERAKETQSKNDAKVVENILKIKMTENVALNKDKKENLLDDDNRVLKHIVDESKTKLDKDKFFYIEEEEDKVVYDKDALDPISKEDFEQIKTIFEIYELDNREVTILGLKEEYQDKEIDIGDLRKIEYQGRKIVNIQSYAFEGVNLKGSFPQLKNLRFIEDNAFNNSTLSGKLPNLPKLEYIGEYAFQDTNISGQLPYMPNLEVIENWAFFNTQLDEAQKNFPKWNPLSKDRWTK